MSNKKVEVPKLPPRQNPPTKKIEPKPINESKNSKINNREPNLK